MENIKVKELLNLEQKKFDEYNIHLSLLKPRNTYLGKHGLEHIKWKFGKVLEFLQYNQNIDSLFKVMCYVFDIKIEQIQNSRVIDFYHATNFIKQQLDELNSKFETLNDIKEDKYTQLYQDIAKDRLKKYKLFPYQKRLEGIMRLPAKEVNEVDFGTAFVELLFDKDTNEIEKEYSEKRNKMK